MTRVLGLLWMPPVAGPFQGGRASAEAQRPNIPLAGGQISELRSTKKRNRSAGKVQPVADRKAQDWRAFLLVAESATNEAQPAKCNQFCELNRPS